MLKKLILIILMVGSLLGSALAQGHEVPLGKWWHNQRVIEKFNLSSDELNQLDRAFRKSRRQLIGLRSQVEKEQFDLETLFENKELDEKKAFDQHYKLEKARTALATERFRFFLTVRKILGLERFEQLRRFNKMRRQKARRNNTNPKTE